MGWMLAIAALVVVAALVVDRRRGRPRSTRDGDDAFRDAGYGEGAATSQAVRRTDGTGGFGAG